MGIKVKTTKNEFPRMEKTMRSLNGRRVKCGAIGGGEHAWLAGIHEYGCRIPVTPKMRAYLHNKGLHLKESTTEIVIPERSFLRAGFDEHHQKVENKVDRTLPDVLAGTMSKEQFLETIGILLSSKIKDYARDLSKPANHPFTVEQKGSSNPLVDTGAMIESITYEVE